jgi:Protein of unknown function (DUF2510)
MTQLQAQPAAGWYADPSGHHEARYWDGDRWTDRVADRGVENSGSPMTTGDPAAGAPEASPDPFAVEADPRVEGAFATEAETPEPPAPTSESQVPSAPPMSPAPEQLAGPIAGDPPIFAGAAEPEPEVAAAFEAAFDAAFEAPAEPEFETGLVVDAPPDAPVDVSEFAAPTAETIPIAPVPPVHAPLDLAGPPSDPAVAVPVAPPEPGVPAAGPEIGWYPDPTGRHEVRYWDGGRWTERVADDGVETTEIPAADVLEVAAGAMAADAAAMGGPEPVRDWAPDWYPDPTGRHEVRYFDGTTWTEHVANNGLSALDPIADGAPLGSNAAELAATIVPAVSTAASPHATTVEAAEAAFAAALSPAPAEEPEVVEAPAVLPVSKDWASRPNALVGWIVVIGAGILAVGSVGPWAKATAPVVGEVTQNGMSGDGRFMLALAVLLIATGIGLILGRFGRVVAFSALSLGTLAAIVCAVDMARISNGNYGLLQGTVDATASAGVGLWACLVGAIVCIAGGIVAVTHR